ncbi:putative Ig domain-containing protein [Larkinella terrae]|uniref:T9SS type A sorting domain-containing protein n=1 Tax=Larkinella terrae TaxID=2025311 RepID=A0A7K0EWH0_9BACT|nr:putative Ig domain-containing protein [Larkinella terrae]MRS65771.1 T9SS type A sorting domain-containing protein [Larkinella terrae]
MFRQDLQTAGKGNGKHAFTWSIPESLKDGLPHNLSARIAGSSFILKDSPKALICQGTSSPANKAPVPPSPTVLIAPLAAQVGVPFSGTLVAFTDPEGQLLTYQLSGLPGGLSINPNTRVISGTPTEAGTFPLAYSASDGVLTNSVSFPLLVNPASTTTVTGNFEGYLDKVECGTIRGWVWDRNKPNTPLTVEFYHNVTKQVFGSTVANFYRQDLKDAGKGNGVHGYSFTVPESLKDGVQRPIMARVLGSTYELKGGPKVLTCNSPTRLSAETSSQLQVTVLGNPVSDQVTIEVRGAEGKTLKLQLTDASGRLIGQRQIEAAQVIEQHRFSVQGQPSGILVLRVNSGLKGVTLKVLKQ